jgi:hypothetical protein
VAAKSRRRAQAVSPASARKLLLDLPGVEEGTSYGLPSFKLAGKFLARFRDDDEVLVVRLGSIADRDVLMQLDPKSFFFTDHYRDHPAVLIRLAHIRPALLAEVLEDSWRHGAPRKAARAGGAAAPPRGKRGPRR